MPWTDVSTAIPGTVYTAARRNTEVRDNLALLREGGLALASQAQYDLLYALSASQLGRIPNTALALLKTDASKVPSLLALTAGQVPRVNAGGTDWEGAIIAGGMTPWHANSGTTTNTSAENMDTCAFGSGDLDVYDTVHVHALFRSATQATNSSPSLYHVTDSTALWNGVGVVNLGANVVYDYMWRFRCEQSNNGSIYVTRFSSSSGALASNGVLASLSTGINGAWTLGLRHNGVTSGGTLQWSWIVSIQRAP